MFFVNSIFFRWWNWIFFHLLPKLDGDVELISHDERFLVKIQFNIIHHHRSPVLPPKRNLHNFYVHQNNNNIGGSERGEKYQLATWPFLEYANRTHTQRTEMVLIESHWGERERDHHHLYHLVKPNHLSSMLSFLLLLVTLLIWMVPKITKKMKKHLKTSSSLIGMLRERERDNTPNIINPCLTQVNGWMDGENMG